MDPFADIRPYRDEEVRPVLDQLLADAELYRTIGRLRFGKYYQPFRGVLQPLLRWVLRRELAHVDDVRGFQGLVKRYMDRMIERTTSGFTVSGIEALQPDTAYLFMSNHRDISLDPAFVNYALYQHGHDTVRIAIGDNLLTRPFASDLMRLNKSFIVKRSAKGPRQALAAHRHLSAYIRHSLHQDNASIWIAQREGRAKDSNDRTEPAILKMLAMARDKASEEFSDYIAGLRIVPVAISYEFDPCDASKAQELYAKASTGAYQKGEQEDLRSIGQGIAGNKGAVHVAFGTPLSGRFESADQVAAAVDNQVIRNYVLHPTNFFAYHRLHRQWPTLPCGARRDILDPANCESERQAFNQRIDQLPERHRPYALAIYANPVSNKLGQRVLTPAGVDAD